MSECTELLNAARHYVQNYLLDEYKDARLCCCGEAQHRALVALFDAIKDAEKLAPVASCEWCAAEKHRGRHLAGCPNEPSPAQPTILAKGDPGWVDYAVRSEPAQPVGWQLVPYETTAEMRAAGANADDGEERTTAAAHDVYQAMLAAAPRAEKWRITCHCACEEERITCHCACCRDKGRCSRAELFSAGDREDISLIPMGPVGATYGWPGQDEDKREAEPDEERAWLIEFVEARWGTGYFWIGVSEFNEWGTIDKAVRFAREEDANRVIESLKKRDSHITGMHYEAHEHSWLAARAKGGSK